MSFLHPLFLLAVLAIGVPLYLHLARRRNRAAIPWSSLRFLQPDPPRFEGRKRIEQWLLMLLRCLAVVLLAVTFARPLFRRPVPGGPSARGARVVILVDTSASMQRPGVWAEAKARAQKVLRGVNPEDRVALLGFSDRTSLVLGFDAWAAAPAGDRRGAAEARLATLGPGWGGTDLGAALIAAAEAIGDDASTGAVVAEQKIVLVSDLTQGARLGALSAAEWPAGLRLEVERIDGGAAVNLGVQVVPETAGGAVATRTQVRVTAHAPDASPQSEPVRATLRWSDEPGASTDVMVPPGESRVIAAPARSPSPASLIVEGDDGVGGEGLGFDNRLFVVPVVPTPARIVYLGADAADDATGSRYFLERAFVATRTRAPSVEAQRVSQLPLPLRGADLVVLTEAPGPATEALRAYVLAGGTLLFAPRDAAAAEGLAALARLADGAGLSVQEAKTGQEALLTSVQLTHPLLAAFADGRAGDFSHVRFWKHRVLEASALVDAQVLARFDDGSPAWLLVPQGRGRVFIMTAGWNTGDGQLGLSSKLVPLLWTLLGGESAAPEIGSLVGEPLALANIGRGETGGFAIRRPDGRTDTVPEATPVYAGTDLPGLYEVSRGGAHAWFAVNVAPGESVVAPLPEEQLARIGIAPGAGNAGGDVTAVERAQAAERARESVFFRELEAQQKPWRHVLLGVLLALLIEGLLTARRAGLASKEAA